MASYINFYKNIRLKTCIENTFKKYKYELKIDIDISKNDTDNVNYLYTIKNLNKSRLYELRICYTNNELTLDTLKKYVPANYQFPIPILAMCLCLSLIDHNPDVYKLSATQGHNGLECCLLCHYQKFGFQPVKDIIDFKNQTEMEAKIPVLSKKIPDILSDNNICY